MALFKLTLITLGMFYSVDSTCGPPGTPVGADIYGHTSNANEGQTVSYMCKHQFKQVYGNVRKCTRGKWTATIPKCVAESNRLTIENYKVNYFDIKDSAGYNVNQTFKELDMIRLNQSRRFTFQVHYAPKARLSYVELDVEILSDSLPSSLKVSLFINDYRDCLKSTQSLSKANSVIKFKFICEAKSDVDYEIEGKDLPNSLRFSFESQFKFSSIIKGMGVFRFQDGCGSPDIPLNAKTIVDSGKIVSIYPSKPERYKTWTGHFDTVTCLYEGNWDNQLESLYPIINCPFEDLDWDSLHYRNISFEYFEYINDTLLAPVDSKIQFQCNNKSLSQDSTDIHYLYCREDGQWMGDFGVCKENETTNNKQTNEQDNRPTNKPNQLPDDSNFFVIIVTLLSTFITTLTFVLICGSVIFWRRKQTKKRKLKELSVKYVKDYENYGHVFNDDMASTTHYEAIDYQAIDSAGYEEFRSEHHYMTLF